ncbi:MAG TPA: hypothetical protein P5079_10160 [Elusimicrobiota bacterium]|nr:hypothetical protein [Elusimicrobiota bacterium]
MFEDKIRGEPIRIINLAEQGACLEDQYWKLFRELFLRPPKGRGVLLIYAGINEPAGPDESRVFFAWRLWQRSIVLSRLEYLMRRDSEFLGAGFTDGKYETRLQKIIGLGKKHGLTVIVSTLVGNLRYEPTQDNAGVLEYFGEAYEAERREEFRRALGLYEEARSATKGGVLAFKYFHTARCHERLGEYETAKEFYWKAVDCGNGRRPTRRQNRIIVGLAKKNGVLLVDAARRFEERAPHGIPGYDLFMDAHHPAILGYLLLATGFSEEIGRAFQTARVWRTPTPADIASFFEFGPEDFFDTYISRVLWFCGEATEQEGRSERMEIARRYLAAAERIHGENINVYLGHLMICTLEKDSLGIRHWLEKGKFLTENKDFFETNTSAEFRGWFAKRLAEAVVSPAVGRE